MRYPILTRIAVSALVASIGGFVLSAWLNPYDDTDSANKERSGLVLRTDHGTGCQYLLTPWDRAITPRMGADGKQVCKRGQS